MLLNDADSGKSNWVSKSRDFQMLYDIRNSDNHSVLKHEIKQHFGAEILRNLGDQIAQDKKLKTCATFKSSFKFEFYVDAISDFKIRSTLAKLRLSAHTLQIETSVWATEMGFL